MRNKIKTFCLILFFGALFFQVQTGLSIASSPDTDSTRSLNKIEYYEREGIIKSVVQTFVSANKTIQRTP
jgi:hypothetical protein